MQGTFSAFPLLLLIQISVLIGRVAYFVFEQAAKMLGIFEPEFVRNFTDGFFRVEGFCLGNFNDMVLNMVLGRFTGFIFDQVTKIIGR